MQAQTAASTASWEAFEVQHVDDLDHRPGPMTPSRTRADTAGHVLTNIQDIPCRINLIPFHPIPLSPLRPSPRESIHRFQAWLKEKGIRTTIRQSWGLDIAAACGLLSTRELMREAHPMTDR